MRIYPKNIEKLFCLHVS